MIPPSLHPVRALLLDVGGTILLADLDLVGSVLAEERIVVARETLQTALLEANRHYARAVSGGAEHGAGLDLLLSTWLEHAGLSDADSARGLELLLAAHDRYCLWRTVADGAAEGIAELRSAGVPVGVVSNSEGKLQQILDRAGLGGAFDTVLDSALEGLQKPDPEIFLRACARLDVAPGDALYAGDMPEVDVRGAIDAGLQGALIDPYGAHPSYTEASRFSSVAALVAAIIAG